MNRHRTALCMFAFSFLIALPAMTREIAMPIELSPLKGDILQARTWDFSQQWMSDDKARTLISVYGDSLMAETIGGRRYWYGISGDSILYISEEDRLTTITASNPVYVASLPLRSGAGNGGYKFDASGTGGGKRFAIKENGTLEFMSAPYVGTLIMTPGDTIHNVTVTRERRYTAATFPDDSVAAETYLTTETYRWYDSDGASSLLPLAVQRSVYASGIIAADTAPLSSSAYLPDRGACDRSEKSDDEPFDHNSVDPEAVSGALDGADLKYDGRNVTVSIEMPVSGLNISLDIMDAAGRLYLHKSAESSGSADEISLDCSSLRSGQYIAAIGVAGFPVQPKKEIIIIR